MNSISHESSPLESQTETNLQTALIRRADSSMLNGGGGRYQLLARTFGLLDGATTLAGAGERSPAQAVGASEA